MKRKDFSKLQIEAHKIKDLYYEHEDFGAGIPPFLRGTSSSLYFQKSANANVSISLSSPRKCNTFLKEKIAAGFTNFLFYFQVQDELNPSTQNESSGIQLHALRDIKELLADINLSELKITIGSNSEPGAVFMFFIEGLIQLKINFEDLNLSVQLRNIESSNVNSLNKSIVSFKNIFSFTQKFIPNFNSFEISSIDYNKNSSSEIEVCNLLIASDHFIQSCISETASIDLIISKISFSLKIGSNHFDEIAKLRATRMLWAKFVQNFKPKNPQSQALQINAIAQHDFSVFSSILGGCNSVTSNKSAQLFFEKEALVLNTIDPWGGSNLIEKKTEIFAKKVWELFKNSKNN